MNAAGDGRRRDLILIVDDMTVLREPLEMLLQSAGYETATASNGAEALAKIGQRIPDLILLDMRMPVMDGIKFLESLRGLPRLAHVPVLAFSEAADRARVVQAVKLGVRGYLLKSQFTTRLLLDRIESILAKDHGGCAAGGEAQAPHVQTEPKPQAESDPAARLRTLRPIMSRTEVLERMQACDQLKALSPTVAHVLKLTSNDRCSVESVAKAIAQDHAIALKILKLANSTVYTRGEPVDSVHKAVVRIGMDCIRQAVLNISVVERFNGDGLNQVIDTFQFWEHAIATGLIAAELAHATAPADADAAFTTGLLHDVGRVICAEQLGPTYVQVVQKARELELPLEQVETRMLLMNHADVMERVLQAWKFAKHLAIPIVHHHLSADGMRTQVPSQLQPTARLALANRLASALLLGSSGNEVVYPVEDLCAAIRVPAAVLDRITETAREQTDNVKFAMLSSGSGASWKSRRDLLAEEFAEPFWPLFAAARPQFDSYRVLCAQFPTPPTEAPNIAVVHVPSPRDKEEAVRSLRARERDAGVNLLPALVLSPGGRITLEEEAAAGRVLACVPTPLVQSRLIAAVNTLRTAAGCASP